MLKFVLLLLVFISFAFAGGDPSSLSSFINDTLDTVATQGQDFVDATGAAAGGVGGTVATVYHAFGPATCGSDWISTRRGASEVVGLWLVPAVFVAMIVAFGIAIVYIMGQFFSSPQLIAIAKDEAFQTALTVLRVGFVMGALMAGETWFTLSSSGSTDIIYGNNDSMIDAAMAFARLMVSDMMNHYSVLLMYNMVIHTVYSSTMWFGVTWRAMYSFNLGPVLKPLIDIIGTALQYLSVGMSTWLLHIVTLCIIKKWMWALFIPVAMLLRALPSTREAGEALFALSFALAVFYPFMFLFDYEVHKIMKWNIIDGKDALSSFINKSGLLSVFGAVFIMMLLSAGVFMPFFLGSALSLAFELIRGAVYYIVIMSLFLPFLNIFVTLTAAKEVANFFRVDVNFLSFLKII